MALDTIQCGRVPELYSAALRFLKSRIPASSRVRDPYSRDELKGNDLKVGRDPTSFGISENAEAARRLLFFCNPGNFFRTYDNTGSNGMNGTDKMQVGGDGDHA